MDTLFNEPFDLLEFQQKAREMVCPKKLFAFWENICRRYERHEIGQYQLDEMKEVIWPNLLALSSLRKIMDEDARPLKRKTRRRRLTAN